MPTMDYTAVRLKHPQESIFEITKREGNDKSGNITLKEYRTQVLNGLEEMDSETGVKIYKDINIEDISTYLEKKYEFVKRNIWIAKGDTPKGLTSKLWRIRVKKTTNPAAVPPVDDVF